MLSSKRNRPCPVCNRTKDGDCRFGDDVILCHVGSTFAPPSDLRLGDTVFIEGKKWALTAIGAGYDGQAHCFKPHKERIKKHYPYPHRKQQEADSRRLIEDSKVIIEQFLKLAQAALDVLEFETAPPDELKESIALIDRAFLQGKELQIVVRDILRKEGKELRPWSLLLDEAIKQLTYQKKDSDSFRRNYLGEVLP